jgi:hypothetical protein
MLARTCRACAKKAKRNIGSFQEAAEEEDFRSSGYLEYIITHSGCCQLIRHYHRIPALLSFTFSSSMFRFHPTSILLPQLAARFWFKCMKSSIQQRVVIVGEVKAGEEDMACTDPPTLLKLDVLLRDTVAEGLREGGGFYIQLLRCGVCLGSFW